MAERGRVRRRRRGDDGAPGRRRPVGDVDAIAIQQLRRRRTTGEAAHAAARPVEGPQRARRRGARLHERRRAAPAHPPERAHPRHLHRRPATSPTSCRARRRRRGTCARRTVKQPQAAQGAGPRLPRGRRRGGRLHDGARVGTDPPTPTWSTTGRSFGPTSPTASGSAARVPTRRASAGRRQHRHGQRQLPRAVDPPDDPGRPRATSSIHTPEFAPLRPGRRRRPGGARRGQGHGDDRRRPVDRAPS